MIIFNEGSMIIKEDGVCDIWDFKIVLWGWCLDCLFVQVDGRAKSVLDPLNNTTLWSCVIYLKLEY